MTGKYVALDGHLYPFKDQAADVQAAWKDETCSICGLPAIGLIAGTINNPPPGLENLPNMLEHYQVTSEQQSFLEQIRDAQPDDNFFLLVCESHALADQSA